MACQILYQVIENMFTGKAGDTVEFTQTVYNTLIPRRGVIKRIDEFGDDYNMHIKCEYVSPLGCDAVVYPSKETVKKIENT